MTDLESAGEWRLLLPRLGDAITRALLNDPKTGEVSPQCFAGATIDVEALLDTALDDCFPRDDELHDSLRNQLPELPTTLLHGDYYRGGSWSLDLLDTPGRMSFITVPANGESALPMRAIAGVKKPVTTAAMSAMFPHLLPTNHEDVFETPPDWIINHRPDLIPRDTFRAFLSGIDQDSWQPYQFDPPLDPSPVTKDEFVEAYLTHSYSEAAVS